MRLKFLAAVVAAVALPLAANAAPIPVGAENQDIYNFDFTSESFAPFDAVSVRLHLNAQPTDPVTMSYYGGANGTEWLGDFAFPTFVYYDDQYNPGYSGKWLLQLTTANESYAPMHDGLFSIGLSQAVGATNDLFSLTAQGLDYSPQYLTTAWQAGQLVEAEEVPEPAVPALLGLAVLTLGLARRRKAA